LQTPSFSLLIATTRLAAIVTPANHRHVTAPPSAALAMMTQHDDDDNTLELP
ncbi:hypothetical protein K443DRAFT_683102, partial [Laccaria amethystina LaAM-08-1]